MGATIEHSQTVSLPLNASLVERLQKEATYEHRSLTSLVEAILTEALKHRPNPETMAAIEEARSGKDAETYDSVESLMAELMK